MQLYRLKNLTSLHPHIVLQLNHILDRQRPLPDWMNFGKIVLCQKDPVKGSAVNNYRPISCLPLIWKLIIGILAERENVLSSKQKGCCQGSHGTKDQLLTDKTVLIDCKRRHTDLAMT